MTQPPELSKEEREVFRLSLGGLPELLSVGDWAVRVWPVEWRGRLVIGALTITPAKDAPALGGPNLPALYELLQESISSILEWAELPPQGLTARELRRIKFASVIETRRNEERAWRKTGRSLFTEDALRRLDETARGRGRRVERNELADTAESYLESFKQQPHRPISAMVEDAHRNGRTWVTRSWVRDRVQMARDQGFLTKPERRGFGGGEAGPELLKVRVERAGRRKGAK